MDDTSGESFWDIKGQSRRGLSSGDRTEMKMKRMKRNTKWCIHTYGFVVKLNQTKRKIHLPE